MDDTSVHYTKEIRADAKTACGSDLSRRFADQPGAWTGSYRERDGWCTRGLIVSTNALHVTCMRCLRDLADRWIRHQEETARAAASEAA